MNRYAKAVLRYPFYFGSYYLLNYLIAFIPIWVVRKCYYRLWRLKIGKDSEINMNCLILSPFKIAIGDNTHVNSKCFIDGRGGIKIGNSVSISFNVKLVTGSHDINTCDFKYVTSPIHIEDHVWIGIGATILPGVVIHRGAVVAAGAVVTKEVPEMAVVAGIPAKIVGYRIPDKKLEYKCRCNTPFS